MLDLPQAQSGPDGPRSALLNASADPSLVPRSSTFAGAIRALTGLDPRC